MFLLFPALLKNYWQVGCVSCSPFINFGLAYELYLPIQVIVNSQCKLVLRIRFQFEKACLQCNFPLQTYSIPLFDNTVDCIPQYKPARVGILWNQLSNGSWNVSHFAQGIFKWMLVKENPCNSNSVKYVPTVTVNNKIVLVWKMFSTEQAVNSIWSVKVGSLVSHCIITGHPQGVNQEIV